MNIFFKTVIRIFIIGLLATGCLNAQPYKEFKWQPGEELVYRVKWTFIFLGNVTLSNLGLQQIHHKEAYHIRVKIESNPLLFWLDNESIYDTYITDSLQVLRFISDENVDGVSYNAHYDFDYQNKKIKLTLYNKKSPADSTVKEIDLKPHLIDGIGLIQFARINSLEMKKDTISTFIEDKSGDVVFDFSLSKHITKIDAIPDGINTVYFNGEMFLKGIAGITGPFETWFSDDSSRVPILAYLEVFIGRVKIELDSWKNWSPHKLVSEDIKQ